jgi:phosphoglucomutase
MSLNSWVGKSAEPSMLVNVPRLMTAYYTHQPDPDVPEQGVVFGTSGHRGSAFEHSFNEAHILAMSQAICLYRQQEHIDGPLFLGIDTHALSESAFATALEVLAANGIEVMIDAQGCLHPDPGHLARHLAAQSGDGRVAWPTALSSPPRITHLKMGDSSIIRPTAARLIRM